MIDRAYEALVILKTAGTEQEVTRQAAALEEPIKRIGGRLEHSQSMGRRKLAYRIAHQQEGYYVLLRFQAQTERVAELERQLRLNEAIVRFMIVDASDTTPLPQPAAAAKAA